MKKLRLKRSPKLAGIIKGLNDSHYISFEINYEDKDGNTKTIKKEIVPDNVELDDLLQIAALMLLIRAVNGELAELIEVEDYLKLAQRN